MMEFPDIFEEMWEAASLEDRWDVLSSCGKFTVRESLLHEAVNYPEALKLILTGLSVTALKKRLEVVDFRGDTVLHAAARAGTAEISMSTLGDMPSKDIVDLLMKRNNDGYTVKCFLDGQSDQYDGRDCSSPYYHLLEGSTSGGQVTGTRRSIS